MKTLSFLFSQEKVEKIEKSLILIAGCGGVGCELVKNIIKSGFKHIVLVDNDYVEISNLNRQFYFNRQTIKKSKAFALRDMVLEKYNKINIEAYCCDIQDKLFNFEFFSRFTVVLSALDNREAKEHLNLMCIKCNLPLIMVGVEGFSGQIKTIIRQKTECFCCNQPYPNQAYEENSIHCQIKGIPETSKDCVIWAKNFLENLLFGLEIEIWNRRDSLWDLNEIKTFWIKYMEDLFSFNQITLENSNKINKLIYSEEVQNLTLENHIKLEDQKIHSIGFYAKDFVENIEFIYKLSKNKEEMSLIKENKAKKLSIYNDENNLIDFLSSAVNLRIFVFKSLKPKLHYLNKFEIRTMVEKIIPSIASTNSIIAAIQIKEAISLILNEVGLFDSRIKWVSNNNDSKILASEPTKNREDCSVCSGKILYFCCFVDFTTQNLEMIIKNLQYFKQFQAKQIVYEGKYILYDCKDKIFHKDYEINIKKTISDLKNDKNYEEVCIRISTMNQKIDFEWDLTLRHKNNTNFEFFNISKNDAKNNIKSQLLRFYQNKETIKNNEKMRFIEKYQ